MVMAVVIRQMSAADLEDADNIAIAAYQSPSRRQELARYLSLQQDGWLLAELDGMPAGIGGATVYEAFAYIGMVAVLPRYQRHGIGRAVMHGLLDGLLARGCSQVRLDASPAGAPLYASLGLLANDRTLVMVRAPGPHSPPAFETPVVVRQLGDDELTEIMSFDAPCFGAPRPALLASYVRDDPTRVLVARQERHIVGYLIAQQRKLGPWVASTRTAGEALLRAALSLSYAGEVSALVPKASMSATALLARYGFRQERPLTHMRRGEAAAHDRREHVYGLASLAVG